MSPRKIGSPLFFFSLKMERNKDIFKLAKIVLVGTGTWQLRIGPKFQTIYALYRYLPTSLFAAYNVSTFIKASSCFGQDKIHATGLMGLGLMGVVGFIKTMMFRQKKMTQIIKEALEDQSDGDPEVLENQAKYARLVATLSKMILVYSALALSYQLGKEQFHYHKSPPEEPPLGKLLLWLPFNSSFGLALWLQYFLLGIAGLYIVASHILVFTLIFYVIRELHVLQHKLKTITRGTRNERDVSANLTKCILRHQRIIKYVKDLNDVMKTVFLMEYSLASVLIASVIFGMGENATMTIFGPIAIYQASSISCISWICEEIKVQSENVGYALYQSEWCTIKDVRIRRDMIIVMIRCRKGLTLDIGSFGPNAMEAAMARLKMTYSMLSLMRLF